MSTDIYSNSEINSRLKLLVDQATSGNVSDFAKLVKINIQTLHTYIKGRAPSSETLFNICINLQVNLNWLLTGNGPIYIKDDRPLDPDPEISRLIESARRVLTSGNNVAFDALERNINYFDFAIQQEKRMAELEKRLSALEDKKSCESSPKEDLLPNKKAM